MAESFFVEPAVNGPVAAPAVENSSVRVDARAGGVHVDSQSIHRSHSLFITPIKLASNPVDDPNIAAAASGDEPDPAVSLPLVSR